MAAFIRTNNAEGGTNGVTVTTANSGGASGDAFNSIVGTGLTFSNLVVGAGSLSYRTANASVYAVWNGLGAITNWTLKARVYFANVSATQGVMYAKETAGDYTSLEYSGSTKFWRIRGTGGTASGTVALSAATWYDVELSCANSNTNTARIYNTSGTLLDSVSFANTVTVNLDEAWFGSFVATGVYPSYFDTFGVQNDKLDSLTANGLTSNSSVGNPVLTVVGGSTYDLTANGLTSTSSVGTPALTQTHELTATGLVSSSSVGQPALTQSHVLVANGLTSTSSVGQPALTQGHSLTANGLVSASSVGQPALVQVHSLGASGLLSASYVGNPALAMDGLPPILWAGAWTTDYLSYVLVSGTWREAKKIRVLKNGEWI